MYSNVSPDMLGAVEATYAVDLVFENFTGERAMNVPYVPYVPYVSKHPCKLRVCCGARWYGYVPYPPRSFRCLRTFSNARGVAPSRS